MDMCKLCGREFWSGATSQPVIPIASDGDYCQACASAACDAIDDIMMQATRLENGWIGIPEVEYTAIMSTLPKSDASTTHSP